MEKKEYTNGELTVIWQPAKCTHSGFCACGLFSVFNPQRRPWIDMSASTTERIVSQIEKCPSGALSYRRES